jgi:hypothetical protein
MTASRNRGEADKKGGEAAGEVVHCASNLGVMLQAKLVKQDGIK